METRRGGAARSDAPFFSVVVPVCNGADWVGDSIRSILAQTFTDWELILVDDGSTDQSLAILREWVGRDARISVLSQENRGRAIARNVGIRAAHGEWVAQCDADDLWEPEKLHNQKRFIDQWTLREKMPLTALGTCGWYINERGRIVGRMDIGAHAKAEYERKRDQAKTHYLLSSSVVFRKSAAEQAGLYDPSFNTAEDIDLWSRLADLGVVLALTERLVRYRMHPGSAMALAFEESQINAVRVRWNIERRRSGLAPYSYAETVSLLEQDPARYHALRRQWKAHGYYRAGGSLLANGKVFHGLGMILRALCAAPPLVCTRVFRQIVIPRRASSRTN